MIDLNSFVVLKKLSIKNIDIEPWRVKADYCVERFSGETNTYELIYSYGSAYFNRKNAEDINLASMMVAQVALNYGLFFETIEFDGLYDKADQTFLANMMENTSREIYTNKLLIKNEFIKPPYNEVRPEKKAR